MSGTESGQPRKGFPTRRLVISAGVGAAAAAWWAWPKLAPYFVGAFAFEAVAGVPGFRRIAGGEVSAGMNPLAGLEAPGAGSGAAAQEQVRADICGALFGGAPAQGVVPVAAFADYYCPFCRVLTQRLDEIERASGGGVRITWHEWPLLGSNSEFAARAALAADRQGAYAAFHKRLMRTSFVPTPEFLEVVAKDIGIDPAQMAADMRSAAVSERLRTSTALAAVFGFRGTPALVVGRTVVVGAITDATLKALIEQERADGPIEACTA